MLIEKKKIGDIEHCWYESSNIFYTKVDFSKVEKKILNEVPGLSFNVPTVDVTVVFNRGAQYLYKGVELHDYTSFVNVLNREDSKSHGKSFIKYIKSYPVERLDDVDINELEKILNKNE